MVHAMHVFLSWKNVPPPQNENGPTCCGIFTKKKTLYEHERDIEFTLSLIFRNPKNHTISKLVLLEIPKPCYFKSQNPLFLEGPSCFLGKLRTSSSSCLKRHAGPSSFHLPTWLIWGSTSIHSGKWRAGTPNMGGWEDDSVPFQLGDLFYRFHVNYQGCIVLQCLHLYLLPGQNC